jgi:hypothetical protein
MTCKGMSALIGQANSAFIVMVLLLSGLIAVPQPMASAATSLPWADRPPTLDPTFGLPKPTELRHRIRGAVPAWIWASKVADNQIIYLRDVLNLKTVPHRVLLYATADDHLQVFLNGVQVTTTFGHHDQVWRRARKVAVSQYLRPGRNIIAVRAENILGSAGVALWLVASHKTMAVTDGRWRVSTTPPVGRGWLTSSFNDAKWAKAWVEIKYGGGPWGMNVTPWPMHVSYLRHLYFQPQRVIVLHGRRDFQGLSTVAQELTPGNIAAVRPQYTGRSRLAPAHIIHLVVLPSTTETHPELLISFRQEVAGRIEVRGSGDTILIGTGESRGEALYSPWGGVHKLNLSSEMTQSTPYSAFRYATVTFVGPGPIKLNRLRLDFKYYPVQYRGAFACSDPLLTKIWYTGAYTAHLCMQEEIWDAPKRDRVMWMGDMQVSGQVINNVFLDRFLMELTMRELRAEAQGGNSPTSPAASYVNGVAGYSNAWFCGLFDFYQHTGAIGFLRSQRQLLVSMLRFMRQGFNRENLFVNKHKAWCFVDWAPELVGNDPAPTQAHAPANVATDLYTCWAVRRAVFMFKALGDKADAAKYARWEKQLVHAARTNLVNPITQTYTNLRQVNAMAIESHVANARQRMAIYSRILGPHCPSWRQPATPYYDNFIIFALSHLGHFRQALDFVRFEWGGMVRRGATTFWERYNPSWPLKRFHRVAGYAMSLCHGWSAGATNWLTECVLGVRPQTGGFAQTSIVPHLGNLQWASGRVPTPHGNIVLRVTRAGAGESLQLTLPPQVQAVVGVVGRSVKVNGVAASAMRRSDGRCYVRVSGAGLYKIVGN